VALRDDLVLLGATAALTGLLVPLVKGRMDEGTLARRRQAEADLARDATFIAAQTELHDQLSTDLWRIAALILSVSYYATWTDPSRFEEAWRIYDAKSFDEVFMLRANVSRSQRLLSEPAHRQLQDFYDWWFGDLDVRLTTRARPQGSADDKEGWSDFHRATMAELFKRIDAVLRAIAQDIGVLERARATARGD
jgi:hypothetical protein